MRVGSDTRGMVGTAVGVLFSVLLVTVMVTIAVSDPAHTTGGVDPSAETGVAERGVGSAVREANRDIARGPSAGPPQPRVRRAIPAATWQRLPPTARIQLRAHVGSFIAQAEAQASAAGSLTRIEPAGDGIVPGLAIEQRGANPHQVTVPVQKTRTLQQRVFDGWERQVTGYRREVVGHRRVQVGTRSEPIYETRTETHRRLVGYERVRTVKAVEVRIPVFRTWTYYETVTRVRVIETEKVIYHSHRECGFRWHGPVLGTVAAPHTYPIYDCWTVRERHVRQGYVFEEYEARVKRTKRYVHHYETDIRLEVAWKRVPQYETYTTTTRVRVGTREVPIYETRPVTERVPVYERVKTYRTVTRTETYTETVTRTVSTAPFTYRGQGNWTLAAGVTESRDASLAVERAGLHNSEAQAARLVATDQSGDRWWLKTWRNGSAVVIETSTGIHRRIEAGLVRVDFANGTIAGSPTGVTLGAGLDDPYQLSVRNGEHAYGTYEFALAGRAVVTDSGSVAVADGLVYRATFRSVYTTVDATYTDRFTVTPTLNATAA